MKLTDEQINTIFDTASTNRKNIQKSIDASETTARSNHGRYGKQDLPARRAMVESIIESYRSLAPGTPVQWIPAVNRKPQTADFSPSGHVVVLRDGLMAHIHQTSEELSGTHYHWLRAADLKCLPKEPVSQDAVEENEFNTWWNERFLTSCPQSKDVARAAWKAAKQK